MILNLTFTAAAAANAPLVACAQRVAQFFRNAFLANFTVPILVDYANIGGLAGSTTFVSGGVLTYAQIKAGLTSVARTPDQLAMVAAMPGSNPTTNDGIWTTTHCNAVWLGLAAGPPNPPTCAFSNTLNWCYDTTNGIPANQGDLAGVMMHEFTEALGRIRGAAGINASGALSMAIPDLFCFASNGVRQFNRGGYPSINNGAIDLTKGTNIYASSSDPGDWDGYGGINDCCCKTLTPAGAIAAFSAADFAVVGTILGWQYSGNPAGTAVGLSGGGGYGF
jgi:hypothetical protein